MFSWTPYPFVRFVFFFCLGIVAGIYLPDILPIYVAQFLFATLAILFIFISYLRTKRNLKQLNPGFIGLAIMLVGGFIQVHYSTDYKRNDHIIYDSDTIRYYKVVLTKQAQEKQNSWKVEAEVVAVQLGNQWADRTGKIMLYFSKTAFDKPFKYGDILLLKGSPQLLKEPANPGEFDYKRFLAFKKIYHQHFLKDGDVLYISHNPPNFIVDYSIKVRVWASEAFNRNIKDIRAQATASALVLGVTDGLDNELLGAYSSTGSLHVLSVSGLHVGIMYWLLLLILHPLTKTTKGKWILALISIGVLWGYAFVTGLSPSVLRAVTMFSFVAVAKPWSRRTNIYNTLAVSAFCLLMYEPYLMMSVGFQLSYLAVFGIVYLQPVFSNFWEPKHWLWENIWQITCVSMAAQIATFVLSLLYFHQFPVYFLLSNLFVIPVSFVVLVLGIVLVAISFIQPVATGVGFLLEWTIKFLNVGVLEMEALPFSLIENIYLTTFQFWLLMSAIVLCIALFQYKKFSLAVATSLCLIVFSVMQWSHFQTEIDTQRLAVYNVNGHSAWEVIDRGQAFFFTDSTLANDRESIRFHIQPNRLQRGVDHVFSGSQQEFSHSFEGCRMVIRNGISILQIHDPTFTFPQTTQFDFIVIGNNAIKKISVLSSLKCKKLILDSSNSFYFASKILKEAQRLSLDVHSVLHHGAFVTKLERK